MHTDKNRFGYGYAKLNLPPKITGYGLAEIHRQAVHNPGWAQAAQF
jgi:hypothetical protein